MKRLLTSAAVAAVLVAGTGSGVQAQGASVFDLSLYGGIGYNYNWLDNLQSVGFDDDRLNPGFAPAVGAAATYWATPNLGIRTNVLYQDIDFPEGSQPETVNGWLYDLDLMLRPFVSRTEAPRLLSSLYLFVGGGGFTANPPGEEGCMVPYATLAGACLPLDWEKATVGQGTAGFGWDVFSLTENVGLFTELAGYVYDSPFHTGGRWAPPVSNAEERDTWGTTGRLTAGLKFSFGSHAPAIVPVPMAPPAPPMAPPMPPPAPPAPPAMSAISVCVVQGGSLSTVQAMYNPATGDTMVNNRPFAEVYPATGPTYAASESWFINNQPVTFRQMEYVRFGVPRVISASQLAGAGMVQGVNVFTETGTTGTPQVIYVPLRPGCEFQPYQLREQIRVRG